MEDISDFLYHLRKLKLHSYLFSIRTRLPRSCLRLFLLHPAADLPPQKYRQDHCDIVCHGLSQDHAVQTEQRPEQVQERDQEDSLPKYREYCCRKSMSHGLHTVHVHKEDTDHRSGKHVCDQHLHTICDHVAVADEQTDDFFTEYEVQDRGDHARCQTAFLRVRLHLAEPLHIARPVIVPKERLHAVCQSHLEKR